MPPFGRHLLSHAVLLALPGVVTVCADTVRSKAGDVLHGKLVGETPDEIIFESTLAGRVSLARNQIDSITVDRTVDDVIAEETDDLPAYFRKSLEAVAAPIFDQTDEEFDWIQLTSGEWLKGQLRAVYHNEVEFNSDELDVLDIDWEKVARLRTSREFSVRINQNLTRTGPLTLRKGKIAIGDGVPAEVGQYSLISIAPEASGYFTGWTAELSLATTLRGGLSTQRDLDVNAVLQRRTAQRRFYFDFLSSYSELEGFVSSNSIRANSYYDILRTRKTFIRAASLEFFRDPLQNIAQRYTLGASYGYYLIDHRDRTWDVSIGPAVQQTTYDTVEPGEPLRDREPAVVLSSQFDIELTQKLDLTGTYSLQWANRTEGPVYHTQTTLEFELTRYLDLDVNLVWDRTEDQVANDSGVEAPKNDVRLTIGIGVDY